MECAGLHVHDGRILVPLDLAVEVTAGKAEDLFDARLAKAGGGVNLEERELAEREHASVFEDVPAFHLALGHAEAAKAILPHNRVRAIEGIDAEVWFVGCAPEAEAVGFRCTLPECRAWQILNRLCTECEDGEERCEEREHNDRSSHEYLLLMVLCKRV